MAAGFNVGGGGGGNSLPGGPVNFYNPAYGGVPSVPNPTATAGQAAGGNAGNLGTIEGLGAGANTFQQGQLLGQYNFAVPNYSALTQSASTLTGQELGGNVPQDVISQLLQGAAERGITGGMPASANSNAAYLRALGLTSLGEQQQGMGNLHQLTADAPIAAPFDISRMFVSPEQQQEAQYASNTMASAPNPAAAAGAAINAATPPDKSGLPWWARGSGMPTALGPGSYLTGSTWHTPAPIGIA